MDNQFFPANFEDQYFTQTHFDLFNNFENHRNSVEENHFNNKLSEKSNTFVTNCEQQSPVFTNQQTVRCVDSSFNQFYDKSVSLSFGDTFDESFCPTTDLSLRGLSKNFEQNNKTDQSNEDRGYYTSSVTDMESCPSLELEASLLEEHHKDLNKELKKMRKNIRKLGFRSTKKGGFCQKKLAHATAESRYRSSINEQIKRLKTLVAGPNANWKKSAILETVAEYIQQLKTSNTNLVEENLQLKMRLNHSTATQLTTTPMNTSYVFVPTVSSFSNTSQISTLMYSLN